MLTDNLPFPYRTGARLGTSEIFSPELEVNCASTSKQTTFHIAA